MLRTFRSRSTLLVALLNVAVAFVSLPIDAAATAHGPTTPDPAAPRAAMPAASPIDLAPTLSAAGAFVGQPGVQGTVDTAAWTLVSNLATGEPPRFAHVQAHTPAKTGAWSGLGSNSGDGAISGTVSAIAVSGSTLYVGGFFSNAAGIAAADNLAKWNGNAWSAVGASGTFDGPVNELAVSGTDLYVGGFFTNAAGLASADYLAKWDGASWSALGSNGGDGALNGDVLALAVSGADVYVGGEFSDAAGIPAADYVAEWDGSAWSALGQGRGGVGALDAPVHSIAVSGADVYVGGLFFNVAGNAFADTVVKWDGNSWSALGSNATHDDGAFTSPDPDFRPEVEAIAVIDGDVYVGGSFIDVAGIAAADYLARWDGSTWSSVGSNGAGDGALNDLVLALAVSGTDIYVGGYFTNAAGLGSADYLAKWDGTSWSALGSNGGDGALDAFVDALATSGTDVYAGGPFDNADGIATADFIARWLPSSASTRKPDGRVRLGSTGNFVGDDVYNTTGVGQNVGGGVAGGSVATFGISVQNDGVLADRFMVKGTKSVPANFTVKYFHGKKNITSAVVAGTFETPLLAFGASFLITAKVTVASTAHLRAKLGLQAAISSAGNTNKQDVVQFTTWRV